VTSVPTRVSAVPRRMRIALAVAAVAVVAVMVVAGVDLRPPAGGVVVFRTSDQFAIAGLGLVFGACLLFLGRSRVDADATGIRVLNIVVRHEYPWSRVRAVRFDRKSAWASLLLENDDEIAVLALQIFDGERTVAAIEGLRALHAAARAAEPPRPPLLYDD
jgi:Bacterial PH domain